MPKIDNAPARSGESPAAEHISSQLAEWALQEFSSQLPAATKRDSRFRFVRPGEAEFSIMYSLPDIATLRIQTVDFVYEDKQWNAYWNPETVTDTPSGQNILSGPKPSERR